MVTSVDAACHVRRGHCLERGNSYTKEAILKKDNSLAGRPDPQYLSRKERKPEKLRASSGSTYVRPLVRCSLTAHAPRLLLFSQTRAGR